MNANKGAQGANISEQERTASLVAGGTLALLGLQQTLKNRSPLSMALLALGGALLYRGQTQHCPLYESIGKNTAEDAQKQAPGDAVDANKTVEISQSVMINRPAQELYEVWRRGEGIEDFSPLLQSVRAHGNRWEWAASAPKGQTLHWETQITEERPGELIRWQTPAENGSAVSHGGAIHFRELAHERGTEVKLELHYDPPGSTLGAALAQLFNAVPEQFALEMLRRFKQQMEAGELAVARSQPV